MHEGKVVARHLAGPRGESDGFLMDPKNYDSDNYNCNLYLHSPQYAGELGTGSEIWMAKISYLCAFMFYKIDL
jgi:hypothetical protein